MGWNDAPKPPGPSAQEKALAEVSAQQWNRRVNAGIPIEDQFLRNTRGTDTERFALRGNVSRSAAGGTAQEASQIVQNALTGGGSTSGGQSVIGMNESSNQFATAVGKGNAEIEPALQERRMRGKLKVAATGRGLADAAIGGLSEAGSRATQAALDAQRHKLETRQGTISGVMGTLGWVGGKKGLFDEGGWFD